MGPNHPDMLPEPAAEPASPDEAGLAAILATETHVPRDFLTARTGSGAEAQDI